MFGNASVLSQFHLWLQPELGFMPTAEHMNVHSFLLIGEYLECIFALASEYKTHNYLLFGCIFTKSFPYNGRFKKKYAY